MTLIIIGLISVSVVLARFSRGQQERHMSTKIMVFWLPDAEQMRRFVAAVRSLWRRRIRFRIAEFDDGFTRLFVLEDN